MSLWGRIFAACYDRAMASSERAGLAARRRELLTGARGAVLEIGAGTGANLEHYGSEVSDLVLLEPEPPMAARLRKHAARAPCAARVVSARAESIPFPDESFDTAVSTLVLCTVEDQPRALSELRRVLRPGGRLIFLEHVKARTPRLARWQDRLEPLWRRYGHGCRCNRESVAAVEAAGFEIERLERGAIPKAPPIVRPLVAGVARRPR